MLRDKGKNVCVVFMLISQTVLREHCNHHKLLNRHACPITILRFCWCCHSSSTTIHLLWKQCIFTGNVPKVTSQKYLQLLKKILTSFFFEYLKHIILAFVLSISKIWSVWFTAHCWKRFTVWCIDIITAEAEDHHYHCSRGPLQCG